MGERATGALPPHIASNVSPRGISISMKGARHDAS